MALQALLAVGAAAHVGLFLWLVAKRLFYPYDLEWMEGGMLTHALRLGAGRPLYGPPSVDFVPFLYTPLYPALLAVLGKIFGVGYVLGRLVSLLALGGALALGYRAARRAGTAPAVAAAAMAAVLAAFPFAGAWYDLVRNDELFLLLAMAGLGLGVGRPTLRGALWGGALCGLSYFAKQTGLPVVLVGIVLVAVVRPRRAFAFALAAGLVFGGGVLILNGISHGWFWTYAERAHARHAFFTRRAFSDTPLLLFRQARAIWIGGAAALCWAALRRRLSRAQIAWALAGGAGVLLGCVAFGTAWAFTNAFIPAVFFPLVAVAALGAGREGPAAVVAVALALHLGTHFYNPRPFCPTPADRSAGDRLLARLRAAPGEVFIPYHPFYAVLAGKPPTLHRMAMLDTPSAGLGRPRGLDEALSRARFSLVVLNVYWERRLGEFPTLLGRYVRAERLVPDLDAPRTFSGAPTWPVQALRPRPEGARILFAPAFRTTDPETRAERRPVTLGRPRLAFDVAGSRDERGCHVDLIVGDRPVRSATGPGGEDFVRTEWDVRPFVGQAARLELVDESRACHLALEELWELD